MLIDLKPQDALFVILGELAQLRVLFGIREESFLQISIMGINLSKECGTASTLLWRW